MLPGAVAYTWLGYAGRSAAVGETSALRYGLLGLGVLAMILNPAVGAMFSQVASMMFNRGLVFKPG